MSSLINLYYSIPKQLAFGSSREKAFPNIGHVSGTIKRNKKMYLSRKIAQSCCDNYVIIFTASANSYILYPAAKVCWPWSYPCKSSLTEHSHTTFYVVYLRIRYGGSVSCNTTFSENAILLVITSCSYGENSCIRCLHLKLRSRNVLQVLASSQETISKCYINEESATATCPTESSLKSHSVAEIILFSRCWFNKTRPFYPTLPF